MLGLGSKPQQLPQKTDCFVKGKVKMIFRRYMYVEGYFFEYIKLEERERDNIVSMHKFTMDQSRSWKKKLRDARCGKGHGFFIHALLCTGKNTLTDISSLLLCTNIFTNMLQ
jgi:hypothetical protein